MAAKTNVEYLQEALEIIDATGGSPQELTDIIVGKSLGRLIAHLEKHIALVEAADALDEAERETLKCGAA